MISKEDYMQVRHRLTLGFTLLVLAHSGLQAQVQPGGLDWLGATAAKLTPQQIQIQKDLRRLADELTVRPNEPRIHLKVAASYFTRGAQDDARRVRRHVQRAVDLDPDQEQKAANMLGTLRSGRREVQRSSEERLVDGQIRAAIPSGNASQDDRRQVEDTIQVGLASRMVKRNLEEPLDDFEEAVAEYSKIFGWNQREDAGNWKARLQKVAERKPSRGWRRAWERAMFRATARASAPTVDPGAEERGFPGTFELKSEAVRAFREGETEEAVDRLVETVAAAEVIRNESLEDSGEVLPEEDVLAPQDPEFSATTEAPPALETSAPPRARTETPEMREQIGQAAMETLEALRNEEVPLEEVGVKIAELEAIGAVGDPLVLDLNQNGVPDLPGGLLPDGVLQVETSVSFDLSGDGRRQRTDWLDPEADGLLVVDLDGDGVIRSGKELFGDALGDPDGFARLAVFDLDGDGWVRGPEASTLQVWRDDGDGVSQARELLSLKALGIRALSCRPREGSGQVLLQHGSMQSWEWYPDAWSQGRWERSRLEAAQADRP
jgi:hypothetical protein